jgi:carboxylesterase type B
VLVAQPQNRPPRTFASPCAICHGGDATGSDRAGGPVSPVPEQNRPGGDDFVFPHRYWLENEACQVLNVWTQNASAGVKKPVLFWVHGGGFTNGSSKWSPSGTTGKISASSATWSSLASAWEYPVNGGVTAFHCSEIAFVFHNVTEPHIRLATGGGPVALALQDKVAVAWLSFAKTGNPGAGSSHVQLPSRTPWSSTP